MRSRWRAWLRTRDRGRLRFPRLSRPGDEWQKIDYENMAHVDKAVAAGILKLANTDAAPKWSDSKEAAHTAKRVNSRSRLWGRGRGWA